jgi:CRP/FNR family transcriptional regulator, anaerobic regulatory protein
MSNAILEAYLKKNTTLAETEITLISAAGTARTVQRNEFLLKEGQVCRTKTFIANGLLRSFGTRPDGSEHILAFSTDNSWVLDPESYHKQTPSEFSIAAIERSEVLVWTKAVYDDLTKEIPVLKDFSQVLISRNNINSRQRLFTALSATPEEKYNQFVEQYPNLLTRLPLHMIAGYLGISLKTLTRIRHAQIHR